MTKLPEAIRLAAMYHSDQMDKSGIPYIAHVLGVWNRVREEDEPTQITALFHDLLEDTSCSEYAILTFGKDVLDAVKLLTHDKKVPYLTYVGHLSENAMARRVKIADLEDNMSWYRLRNLPEDCEKWVQERRATKYEPAYRFLQRLREDEANRHH